MAIERPAADLLAAYHILDEEETAIEAQWQLVEQLNVLQEIIIWITAKTVTQSEMCHTGIKAHT